VSEENVEIARQWAAIWNGVAQVAVIGRDEFVPALEAFNDRYLHPQSEFEIVGGEILGPYSGKGFKGWSEWVLGWASLRHEFEEPIDCGDRVLIPARQYARPRGGDQEMEQRSAAVLTFREGRLVRFEAYLGDRRGGLRRSPRGDACELAFCASLIGVTVP
jgi:hypothetical protein